MFAMSKSNVFHLRKYLDQLTKLSNERKSNKKLNLGQGSAEKPHLRFLFFSFVIRLDLDPLLLTTRVDTVDKLTE